MVHDLIGATLIAALCVVSARIYANAHGQREYSNSDRAPTESPREFRLVYGWIRVSTLVVGLGVFLLPHAVWLAPYRTIASQYLGFALAAGGVATFVAAKRALGRQYSPCFDAHLPTAVVRRGLYSRIRHPIYTANLLAMAGLTIATGSAWMLVNLLLLAFYYRRSAVNEERSISEVFPEYADYVRVTGRFMPIRRARGSRATAGSSQLVVDPATVCRR